MTERLYQHDAYLRTFPASVTAVLPDGVILDRTAFFPTGGGVEGDTGELTAGGTTWPVVETVVHERGVLHRLAGEPPAEGAEVEGRLDWERRYALMRHHTATHVLAGGMFNDYGVRVTGNRLTPDKGRVDFSFPAFDRAVLEEGFRRANEVIARDLPVTIRFIPAAEALERPELFKLETGFPHDLEEIRLVEIGDHDVQADGGCHVAHLGEIGRLVFVKAENKGKANRRVHFVLEQP